MAKFIPAVDVVPVDVVRTRQNGHINTELGTWRNAPRGTAICHNELCQHLTGTFQGKPRTGREFDYVAASVHVKVVAKEPVYCGDRDCHDLMHRKYYKRRRDFLKKKRSKQEKQYGRLDTKSPR